MRLTASLPTFTRLSASVTPAILRTEIPERGTSQGPPLRHLRSSACNALEDLRDELAFAVPADLQMLDLACWGQEIACVVTVSLPAPGRGEFPVAGLQVLSHLFL